MNILFLTLLSFDSISERNIYTDLLREFVKHGHSVYAISPVEKREGNNTHLVKEENVSILRLKIGNIQKTNIVEKGISTVMIEPLFKKAIRQFFSGVKFDLVLYSTPPISFVSAIEYVKKRDGAKTYLLLKDIFPQNAVDIGLIGTSGVKGLLYKHFRKQEVRLYNVSDWIGCMSPANVSYIINNNPSIDPESVEVCPNSVDVIDRSVDQETREMIRTKYGIPLDKRVFVYGGNLGKPQGVSFLIDCIEKCQTVTDAFFLIIGDGTEYHLINDFIENKNPANVKLMRRLPKQDYDSMVGACDIGMIVLDFRFTIPNFPSRLLSYLQAKIPVLACTDPNTDIGRIITDGGFGWWCESNNTSDFLKTVTSIVGLETSGLGIRGFEYLNTNFTVEKSYSIIVNHF